MASVGPQGAGTGGSAALASSSANWSSAGNVTAADTVPAVVVALADTQWSNYLTATNFDFSAIPAGSTVNGITVEWLKVKASGTISADKSCKLMIAGSVAGNEKASASAWPTGAFAYTTYGGAADLWGLTPSLAQVQNSGFGCAIAALSGGAASAASVDFCRITVTYTAAAIKPWWHGMSGMMGSLAGGN